MTTKLHALTDGSGRALVMVLTAGNVNDTVVFAQLMASLSVPTLLWSSRGDERRLRR